MKNTFFDFKIFKVPENDFSGTALSSKNQKGMLLFFSGEENEQEELLVFLSKILQAIQIDLKQDTCFINSLLKPSFNLSYVLQKKEANIVVIFGLKPQNLGIQFALPPYHIIEHQNIQYLWVDDLKAIHLERQNGGKKMSGMLWRSIQQLQIT